MGEVTLSEQELERLEQGQENPYEYPTPEKKDSTLKLFRELIKAKDSRKFGKLTTQELGTPRMAMRDILDISTYLRAEGLDKMAEYLEAKAENTFASSMSKDGWFGNLIVTQIKKETKIRGDSFQPKKTWFGKPKEEVSQ